MARNPIFSSDTFRKTASSSQFAPQGATAQFQPYGQQSDQGFGRPSGQDPLAAQQASGGPLTFDDVMVKTLTVFGILAVGVVLAYVVPLSMAMPLASMGAIVGLVLGLVNSFKRMPSPALIGLYAAAEGVFVGGLTRVLEVVYPGIGMQALLATASIFVVTLLLFRSGKVRATPKLMKFFMIASLAYLVFSLANLVLMLTGALDTPWGLRGMEIGGVPLGAIIGVGVIVLAAISLIFDFDQIQGAIAVGAPKYMAWTCAFGLLVTVVWLYTEILRLIAIIRSTD